MPDEYSPFACVDSLIVAGFPHNKGLVLKILIFGDDTILKILEWACKNGKTIIPLYCFDPRHYEGTHNYKFKKTAAHRLRFLIESVKDLRSGLQALGR